MSKKTRDRYRKKLLYFDYLRETSIQVDEYVKTFLQQHYMLSPETRELLLTRYRFGKPQLRPGLVRLVYELVGGTNWHSIIPFCALIEVKETAYYCIDDVIDKDSNLKLILSGLGYYSISYEMACKAITSLDDLCGERILMELCALDENIFQGAVLDAGMQDTDEKYYWRKVEAYNFWEHVLKIGALCGNSNNNQIDLLGRIGKNIGMAYIITNDAYDIAKDQEDFRQGKHTLPIIYAFQNASVSDMEKLNLLFGNNELSSDDVKMLMKIMLRSGAIDHCKKVAAKLCDEAIVLLGNFPDSEAKDLIEFSTTYTHRNKYFSVFDDLE